MVRLLLFVIVIAGVAGYFTRPAEPVMREAANAVLSDPQNISQGLDSLGAVVAGERAYSNYYVAARYIVSVGGEDVVSCWGAFTQVQCKHAGAQAAG